MSRPPVQEGRSLCPLAPASVPIVPRGPSHDIQCVCVWGGCLHTTLVCHALRAEDTPEHLPWRRLKLPGALDSWLGSRALWLLFAFYRECSQKAERMRHGLIPALGRRAVRPT